MGAVWAVAAGIGFGLFQSINARAVRRLDDVFFSTFLQILASTVVLAGICAVTGELERLADASAWAIVYFAIAGLLHFFFAWTLLNFSQERIGAARTSPLLATVPLWGVLVAAVALGELPRPVSLGGLLLTVAGALVVSAPGALSGIRWWDSASGVATAFLWAVSPIFTLAGLEELDSPLLGVTLGIVAALLAYGALLAAWPGSRARARALPRAGITLKLAGGVLVALATWGRWVALDLSPVAVVLALNLLSVPVVLSLAPLLGGHQAESVGLRVWIGAGLVIAGALVMIGVG